MSGTLNLQRGGRPRVARPTAKHPNQIELFAMLDGEVVTAPNMQVECVAKTAPHRPEWPGAAKKAIPRSLSPAPAAPSPRISTPSGTPDYNDAECAIVDCAIAALPASKLWFTYADIGASFGVSRATIARKVKAGLVPDIRFDGDRVLEDGPVRRFTRRQVRFLLLAVRRR